MIRLVLSDMDATLIASMDDGVASRRTMEAIVAVLDAGVHFGPVTGRTPTSMAEAFPGTARAYATGAFANGQLVRLDGEVVHREWTPAEPLQHVADMLDDLGEGVLTLFDMEGGRNAWYVSREPGRLSAASDFGAHIAEVRPSVEGPSLKANIRLEATHERLVEVRDLLRAEVPELDFVFPSATAPLIDILPTGYGKGSAVVILAEALGLSLDEVATFGDSENDLSMLVAVPNSVAVANASPEAARTARWHIGQADDYAVADALLDIASAATTGMMPSFMCQEGVGQSPWRGGA